jgi:erythromycin esterase-like protein
MNSDGSDAAALATRLGRAARPLATPADLSPLLDTIGDARFVLLGEATHGTAEFYAIRAELSKRLIEDKGFSFVAVEGDWPDCYRVNRYVKRLSDSGTSAWDVLHAFERWPTWMWANRQVADFVEWLSDYNRRRDARDQAGFYGLDVYSLWESMAAVIEYLDRVDPDAARAARRSYGCFDPYREDVQAYARATALVPTSCESEAVEMLRLLRSRASSYERDGDVDRFNAEQNAFIARNAERYYRTMVRGGPASWNVRDHHMVDTLARLVAYHGGASKAIIWAHNTHVGDARFTTMMRHGMVNVGQLVREAFGEHPSERDGVVLVGFGTHRGTVIAGAEWGEPMERMRVPAARPGSLEDLLHDGVESDGLLMFDGSPDGGIRGFDQPLDHRAIGVVYDPSAERFGNYVPTIVPRRYDAFVLIDETRALDPLHMPVTVDGEAETFPSGM